MADSEVRQRKPASKDPQQTVQPEEDDSSKAKTKPRKTASRKATDDDDTFTNWLDALRVLTFLALASCALSYFISNGESFFWGMKQKPYYMTKEWWIEKWQGPPPPIYLTLEELAAYDGTDESKPLYLAINGTIFDVSKGWRIYGPGGSYHNFAGCDAARAYVTGCFADDRTADIRGLEEMYLPLDDPETDAYWSAEELAAMRVRELEEAKQKAHNALKNWVDFFKKSPKYKQVGYLVREPGWLDKEPLKELCPPAQGGRKKRKIPETSEGAGSN